MLSIENKLAPNFNNIMSKISKKYSLAYIKLKDDNYIYPDGNHLYKESGKIVSKLLADDINNMFLNE